MSFDGLNPAQRDAVQTLRGPLLVLAGAGTGKTRVVTIRIANLIRHRTRPERILAVTFTNKAAAEMQERIGGLLGKRKGERPVVSTFHAHCVRILRRHIRHLGYPNQFAIYDRGEQESVARSVLREIRVSSDMLRPGDLLYQISRWKTLSIGPRDAGAVAQTDKEHMAAMGFRRYQSTLKSRGAVDFDDLLLCTVELFEKHSAVRDEEAGRFDHLLIDEYQDTNESQYRIVRELAGGHRNLCVVGDDDQSIYGWRGAEVKHILRFHRDWPEAKVVRLEENYRSTAAILEAANRLIAFNKTRHDKVLRPARPGGEKPRIEQFKDETEEARAVVAEIRRLSEGPDWEPRDFAILFRTNEQPRAFEAEMRRVKLPYVLIGGMSFYDRKEVRDVLAYLKVLVRPEDEVSLLRIINMPPRGIGKPTVERIMERAVASGLDVWSVLRQAAASPSDKPSVAIAAFVNLITEFRQQAEDGNLAEMLRKLLAKIQYQRELERLYSDANEQQSRLAAIEEVVNALAAYETRRKKPTLDGFLDDIALDGQDFDNEKDKQLKRNAVVLMTLHSAKGLEFPHVYMVGMEEGLLPHHRSLDGDPAMIEEERRLGYVGVTRAQERLTLTMALTRRKWGKPRDTIPSQFLFELIGTAENPHQSATRPRKSARPVQRKSTRPRPKPPSS